MKILITGAQGFVGQHLARRLAPSHEVVGTGRRNSVGFRTGRDLVIDWTHPGSSEDPALEPGFDLIVHAAFRAPTGPADSQALRDNETMAENVAKAAKRTEARRLLVLSSGSVYQESGNGSPLTEKSPLHPKGTGHDYSDSCQRIEDLFAATRVPITIARLFFPYGPHQSKERLIPRLAGRILRDEPIELRPDGGPALNPAYITDTAEALAQLTEHPGQGVVNIGGPASRSIQELAEMIARQLGKSCRFATRDDLPGAGRIVCSNDKLKILTDFTPSISLEEGLQLALKDFTL